MNFSSHSRGVLTRQFATAILVFPLLWAQTPERTDRTHPPAQEQMEMPGSLDLEIASALERHRRWKEAEEQYLQAAKTGTLDVKRRALEGIERLESSRPSDVDHFEFDLAKFYEDQHSWKEAEQHYAAAAIGGPKNIRDQALAGLTRVHRRRRIEDAADSLDRLLGYLARVLGLAFLALILWRIWKLGQAIEVIPFEASSEDATKRLLFALSSARDFLPEILGRPKPGVVGDAIPIIVLPGLDNEFPDPTEDLEIAGIKLPLANFTKLIRRPRVRVLGRWHVGDTVGTARARILRRRYFVNYHESRHSQFIVTAEEGDTQDSQLTSFAYDVLVKAIYAWVYD